MSNFYNDYATKKTIIRNIRKWASKHNDLATETIVTHITPELCQPNTLYLTSAGDRYAVSKTSSYSTKGIFGDTKRTTTRKVKSGRVCAKLILEDGSAIYADCRYGNGVANTPRLNAQTEANQLKPMTEFTFDEIFGFFSASVLAIVICMASNSVKIKLISGSFGVFCGLCTVYAVTPEEQRRKLGDWVEAQTRN